MHILALPAFNSRKENPYNWLLYTYMKDLGVCVDEFSLKQAIASNHKIWHLHWPELPLNNRNFFKAFIKAQALLLQLDWARSRGTKTIWTVHNLAAHEQFYPQLETWFWKAFIRRLDGYISLSNAGMEAAQQRFPALKNLPGFVIPHGHYRGEYEDDISPEAARTELGISTSAKVVLFFGRIRAYKNVPQLIKAFRQLVDPEAILCIAGRPEFPALTEAITNEAGSDSRIRTYLDFIPQDKAQLYFRAADLVVLPYREILNSGSALLALSFDCPILVPLRGTLGELQTQVGEDWVRAYMGEITTSCIEDAMQWALNTPRPPQAPLQSLDWEGLAQQTVRAYKFVADIK